MRRVEGARLTLPAASGNVNFMRRLIFAGTFCSTFAASAGAQTVPGRDLLKITLGTGAEPAALAAESGDGVWNPAAAILPSDSRARLIAGALQGAPDQGLGAQLLAASFAVPRRLTVGISIFRASVDDIVRTETDPQTIGPEVPYSTTLASVHVARRQTRHLVTGLALRYRNGQIDDEKRGGFGGDVGVLVDGLGTRDARVGASTFLWQPAEASEAQSTFHLAADIRGMGTDSLREGRVGYGFSQTLRGGQEHYGVTSMRLSRFAARVGAARSDEFGEIEWRLRLGVGLHYARYVLGVAREENGAGLSPTYQFTLSALIR